MARILIVDDSPTEMYKLTGMLEKHGHEVLKAENGADGVALALRTGAQIVATDAVLDEVGIESSDEEEDEVAKFKEFLDEVSPEDFEAPDEDPPAT